MSVEQLLEKIRSQATPPEFEEVMNVINDNYTYTATAFRNGDIDNAAGTNEGSCKIFAFAQLHGLDKEQTLACFGKYYREDVLGKPDGNDHANIRNFMRYGWGGIDFEQAALDAK